jgi:hypothetical protein
MTAAAEVVRTAELGCVLPLDGSAAGNRWIQRASSGKHGAILYKHLKNSSSSSRKWLGFAGTADAADAISLLCE